MSHLHRTFALAAGVLSLSAACTLQETDVPPLTGPSTLALALDVTASPDILPEDGASQSTIRIVARDQNNQPVRGLNLRIDTVVGNAIVDVGTLSARNVTTNNNGEASAVYTAPRARFPGTDTQTVVSIRVLQIGTGFGNTFPREVDIRLVPESVVFDPGAPIPRFSFTPSAPKAGESVFFNASASTDEGGAIVRYEWNYGDGTTGVGVTETHDFVSAGTYFVTLTVTDNDGKRSSTTRLITVSAQ